MSMVIFGQKSSNFASISWKLDNPYYYGLRTSRERERAFFKNLNIWAWADILGIKFFEAFHTGPEMSVSSIADDTTRTRANFRGSS